MDDQFQYSPQMIATTPPHAPIELPWTAIHSNSDPGIAMNYTYHSDEPLYCPEPLPRISGRRSPSAALPSSYITQGARDIPTSPPIIQRGPIVHVRSGSQMRNQDIGSAEQDDYPSWEFRPRYSTIASSRPTGNPLESGVPHHKKNKARLQYALDSDRIMGVRPQRSKYMYEQPSRDGKQDGTLNQPHKAVIQDDGEIDDDTSDAQPVAPKTGARREGSIIDLISWTQDHTDGITEKHILRNEFENIQADWKEVWNMIPEIWKWDLEYHTIHRADGTRHGCWNCTPLESDEPKLYPLTIASAPVVLPVEHQWPPATGLNPPPDPRPSTPIDCSRELPLDTIRDLFLTFEGSLGFYILISGLIQVIVPDNFDLVRETRFSFPLVL
jgi:hypothetical protein